MDSLRKRVVDEARAWLDVPFRHQGRARSGVDCAGLLYVVYEATVGLRPSEDFFHYPRRPFSGFVFRTMRQYSRRIPVDAAGPGDVALLNFAGASTHLGIITDRGVVHADTSAGRVVEQAVEKCGGADRVVACFRMRGVEPWPA